MTSLLPALSGASRRPDSPEAVRFGEHVLTYAQLDAASASLAARIAGAGLIAVWATPTPETVVAVVAALRAGVPAVPLNPRTGERELAHIVADSAPRWVLAGADDQLPAALDGTERLPVRTELPPGRAAGDGEPALPEPSADSPALVVYTSGTTGPPKGAVLPRRAIAASLDALEDAWRWTGEDVLVHALPLFHVHGLILGVIGPLRRGGSVRHLGRFSPEGVARELLSGGTMLFGVPTMYHRLAGALEDPGAPADLRKALAGARLLVSGSAALPVHDQERIASATGRRVVERYGMTETLMNTGVRADGEPRAGTVGPPLPGVELRIVEEDGSVIEDPASIGEIQVRGPNLFTCYLNRPDATAAAFTEDGFFRTGDMATVDPDGYVRIVGRKATDLIKSGGYKIGAGEIENALLEHPGVREAAVTGEPDADLGERIVAWVVPTDPGSPPEAAELADHVARLLAPHKRPRVVHHLDALPRNELGKIMKRSLGV
ncbi:acyl-CoA synthetase [Streptomyces sp. NPDC086010]|uniref:acyl-CoA synthetase n=1 Tax=Streptomyces sp. NPDC086010 TaxID=3365745 RepID=UPI0037D7C5A3